MHSLSWRCTQRPCGPSVIFLAVGKSRRSGRPGTTISRNATMLIAMPRIRNASAASKAVITTTATAPMTHARAPRERDCTCCRCRNYRRGSFMPRLPCEYKAIPPSVPLTGAVMAARAPTQKYVYGQGVSVLGEQRTHLARARNISATKFGGAIYQEVDREVDTLSDLFNSARIWVRGYTEKHRPGRD
jgi:hypothetical protein